MEIIFYLRVAPELKRGMYEMDIFFLSTCDREVNEFS
jgi:hypothetical protein